MELIVTEERLLLQLPEELWELQNSYRRINLSTDRERSERAGTYRAKNARAVLRYKRDLAKLFETALQTARQKHSQFSLIHVLAAQYLWSNRRFEEAALHSRTAIALDQCDLHAQRLLAAAVERSTELVSETDRWLKDQFCSRPFKSLETRANSEVGLCCAAWLPAPVGRVDSVSAEQIWNSEAAQEIRRSILDGDYRYCSRMHCQKIANRELPRRAEFSRHNIGDPCHPEFDAFLEVLRHPSVASPRVGLSTVRPYFDLARKDTAAEAPRQTVSVL